MSGYHHLAGVYAAAITPLKPDYSPDLENLPLLLDFFTRRGCHGALLLGTTGEGPSFAPRERLDIYRTALEVQRTHPDFHLLAGTGTPSLEETIELTRSVFDLGFDGVVVLPPYYYRKVSDDGLFTWFREVIKRGVPADGALFGYHIPQISGVPFSIDLLARLKDAFPDRFTGLKDSSGDPDFARQLGDRFGSDLVVFNGNDRLFTDALQAHASGCITAMANIRSPDLRQVWDAHLKGKTDPFAQGRLSTTHNVMDRYPPAPPLLKALLARWHSFPLWSVRPPLLPLDEGSMVKAVLELSATGSTKTPMSS